MLTAIEYLELATTQPIEIIDVTALIRERIKPLGIDNGLLTVMSAHTTACVNINECEPHLQRDMLTFLKRFVPRDGDYAHNVVATDGRDNAHSHLMALLMTASVSIPIVNGELLIGGWQSVFFIELDGPRPQRRLTLHLMGAA
ncbi:YjbQ family protein [Rhodoferax sp. 4810]|uniref:YjbQ family protein n=1 Tax=Thiospirillum jenense TaxID=1653858 RepID=A0A839H4I1_9GAMM|nr:secondary thiamine-phosphate synthase enzyme YjbQ [Thiospirillum jenense]MBB1073088.1 YjbQ family protein [Rhodoferax jenense]MBB1125035.1 YjbQ family protein [Thiospirillum jenense]